MCTFVGGIVFPWLMMTNKWLTYLLMLCTAALLWSCANIGSPSGGPRDYTPPVLLKSSPKHCYGFYSAHSALSFALAFASSVAIRWGVNGRAADGGRRRLFRALSIVYAIAVFVWAALVALSRVFVAKHFVGDIVAGCLAGIFMAYIWLYAARFVADRFRSRKETSK